MRRPDRPRAAHRDRPHQRLDIGATCRSALDGRRRRTRLHNRAALCHPVRAGAGADGAAPQILQNALGVQLGSADAIQFDQGEDLALRQVPDARVLDAYQEIMW